MPTLNFNLDESALAIQDAGDVPTYSIPLSAHYLRIPAATLRSWVSGRNYDVQDGSKFFRPVIDVFDVNCPLLSFYNLCEAHVLSVLRKIHRVRLDHIRNAINYVQRTFEWERPLIQQEFRLDGAKLFVERLDRYVDAASGQTILQGFATHMERFEWRANLASRLYPFTRLRQSDSPKLVFIDPRYSFGRPVIKTRTIATAIIAERYKAGDSIDKLTKDYGCTRVEIEEGLRCELQIKTAA